MRLGEKAHKIAHYIGSKMKRFFHLGSKIKPDVESFSTGSDNMKPVNKEGKSIDKETMLNYIDKFDTPMGEMTLNRTSSKSDRDGRAKKGDALTQKAEMILSTFRATNQLPVKQRSLKIDDPPV